MTDELIKALSNGTFPNNKNRVWTMCQCALKLCLMALEQAELHELTNEMFYIAWEDSLNRISVKDHSTNEGAEFREGVKEFLSDSGK